MITAQKKKPQKESTILRKISLVETILQGV